MFGVALCSESWIFWGLRSLCSCARKLCARSASAWFQHAAASDLEQHGERVIQKFKLYKVHKTLLAQQTILFDVRAQATEALLFARLTSAGLLKDFESLDARSLE